MSRSGIAQTRSTTVGIESPAARVRADTSFYAAISSVMLGLVLLGFARTLYLRAFFNVPDISPLVWVHGFLLTAWYAAAVVQARLVAARRVDLHRRLGWIVSGIAAALVVVTVVVLVNFASRRAAGGAGGASAVVWSDISALVAFAIFLPSAVLLRRQPAAHKRLMLLSSMSILQPAMTRISRFPFWPRVDANEAAVCGLAVLLLALAVHDLAERKQLHPATALGGAFLLSTRIVAIFVIARGPR